MQDTRDRLRERLREREAGDTHANPYASANTYARARLVPDSDEPPVRLASRFQRLTAQIIDASIAAVPMASAILVSEVLQAKEGAVIAAGALLSTWYFLFADGLSGGQSLAKTWLGMRVIDRKTGYPCSFGQSFVRNLVQAVAGPIDWVFILGDKRQRLGDKAAGTIVVLDD